MIIPFFIPHSGCPHQCVFCNQKNITGQDSRPAPSSLAGTIARHLETDRSGAPAEVAFFGGSFTALPRPLQTSYLEAVQPFIDTARISGIRISTRPDAVTPDILKLLEDHRVRTIELGLQSLHDSVLQASGRGHTAAQSISAVELIKKHAFSLGLQLMAGLPGDGEDGFLESVSRTIGLEPDFVRLYPVLVIRDTPLALLYRTGRYRPLKLREAVRLCKRALALFTDARIEVVRIGLQTTAELEKEGTVIAGPYHPAFRQLVESEVLLDSMRSALAESPLSGPEAVFFVNPADLSTAIGQKRSNIAVLKDQFELAAVVIKADNAVRRGMSRLEMSRR